jgi:hypothetical protein
MEMKIVVQDAASATSLAARLTSVFGADRIALWRDRPEVDIRVEQESDGLVLQVLDAVERWLDQSTFGSAEMRLGEHSYKVARWIPIEETP